jgi:hypothetical protein
MWKPAVCNYSSSSKLPLISVAIQQLAAFSTVASINKYRTRSSRPSVSGLKKVAAYSILCKKPMWNFGPSLTMKWCESFSHRPSIAFVDLTTRTPSPPHDFRQVGHIPGQYIQESQEKPDYLSNFVHATCHEGSEKQIWFNPPCKTPLIQC